MLPCIFLHASMLARGSGMERAQYITRTSGGHYKIGEASFPDLASAAEFAIRHNIPLGDNEYSFAYGFNTMIAVLRDARLDLGTVLYELEAGTNSEWWDAARKFARALLERARVHP